MFRSLLPALLCIALVSPAGAVEIGIAAFSSDGHIPPADDIRTFEQKLGRPLDTLNWFIGFSADRKELPPFPLGELHDNVPQRIVPMLTWEPWGLQAIVSGKLDRYIRSYARKMREYAYPIRLRFGHEMIQDDDPRTSTRQWYPWQDQAGMYTKAYKRIYTLFKREKADNVQFVWCVNYFPYYLDVLPKYYPGPEYVDWIGIDGYNWGGENFDGVFQKIYANITRHPEIFGDKPIMLSEVAAGPSAEDQSFNKARWITDAFQRIKADYPRVAAIYWFNVKKERDWRLDESPESLRAFQEGIKNLCAN